ncbi:MAG: hypothetical protein P4L79_05320 [Legionella sp.]|uniref:hypothetical protein n=1 Tax=Legionella sp. TaxID=459 RepID=UPI00283B2F6E|nr:hypothetical protein [Legionella sp.]
MGYLGQDLLIENLNREFKKSRFPAQFHFNEGGVCNGLAMVYAQYALQGAEKEAEFFKVLKIIADGKLNEEEKYGLQPGSILLFASQVLLAYQPSKYDLSQTQSTSMEMLKINGKSMESTFDFALAAPDKEWSKVIGKIGLQNDEVMIVQSINHAISVRKANDKYRVYDPNYASGFKEFASEEALVKELHKEVFGYGRGNLGMEVHVIRNPDAPPRQVPFPDIQELYEHHLPPKKATAKLDSKTFDTLVIASTIVTDPQVIERLITQSNANPETIFTAAKHAVSNNNTAALGPLLDKINAESEPAEKLKSLIEIAIGTGRLETYEQVEKYFPECYTKERPSYLIVLAAKGGNPKILERVLDAIKPSLEAYVEQLVTENMDNGKLTTEGMDKDEAKEIYLHIFMTKNMVEGAHAAMGQAIEKGNTECIQVLLEQLRNYKQPLDEKQLLDYFLKAIEHNQPYALKKLIDANLEMSEGVLKLVSMSPLSVQRTDLEVLRVLQYHAVPFSAQAKEIIQSKEKDQYRSFTTTINLLINYIQDFFGKKQLKYDEEQLLTMKKDECRETIKELENELSDLKETDEDRYEVYAKLIETERKKLEGEQDFSGVVRIGTKLQALLDKLKTPSIVFNLDDLNFDDLDSDDEEQYGTEDIVGLFEEQSEEEVLSEEVQIQPENNPVEEQSGVTNKFKDHISDMRKEPSSEEEENQIGTRTTP